MTDKTKDKSGNGAKLTSSYNVVSVTFEDGSNTYTALTELKELDTQGQLELEAAAVVTRGDDGNIVVKDQIGDVQYVGAASGGLLGLLIGIIGGPFGVLIGGAYGLLVGSLFDISETEETASVLSQISASVKPDQTALLAEVAEQSPEVVDTAMAKVGGTVLRRPVEDVEAEISAAEKAQRKAKREANKELMRSRREHSKEQVHAKVQELKAKLSHREKETAAS
jgi:uncharacterized membrane protein